MSSTLTISGPQDQDLRINANTLEPQFSQPARESDQVMNSEYLKSPEMDHQHLRVTSPHSYQFTEPDWRTNQHSSMELDTQQTASMGFSQYRPRETLEEVQTYPCEQQLRFGPSQSPMMAVGGQRRTFGTESLEISQSENLSLVQIQPKKVPYELQVEPNHQIEDQESLSYELSSPTTTIAFDSIDNGETTTESVRQLDPFVGSQDESPDYADCESEIQYMTTEGANSTELSLTEPAATKEPYKVT